MNHPHSPQADPSMDGHDQDEFDEPHEEDPGGYDPSILADARDQALAAAEVAREWIAANPAAALGVAAGAGFLIGRVLRR